MHGLGWYEAAPWGQRRVLHKGSVTARGALAVVDVGVRAGTSPLCSLCSFFQQRGPVPPGVPLHRGLLHFVRFPRAAVALQLMVLYFSTKTFCKSLTQCEQCLWSVAAPAPLHLWCWHPQRTCSVPLPRAMRPQPPAKEFSQRPVQVFTTHTPSPPSRGLAARFYPFQGRESLRSLISIAAFEGIYKLRPSPLRLL